MKKLHGKDGECSGLALPALVVLTSCREIAASRALLGTLALAAVPRA